MTHLSRCLGVMVIGRFDSCHPIETRLWRMCLKHLGIGDSTSLVVSGSEPASIEAPCQHQLMLDSGALCLHQTSKLTNRMNMSRTPKQMKTFRENRLELILLGMAIANVGDRDKILQSVNLDSLQSPMIAKCLQAVCTRDAVDVESAKGVFSSWGVKVGTSISGSLVASVNLNNARRGLSRAIEAATDGSPVCIQEAIENVENCLEQLKELQKTEEVGVSA